MREYLQFLEKQLALQLINKTISKDFEIAGVLKKGEPNPILFTNISGFPYRLVGNLLCSKEIFASYNHIPVQGIIPFITNAIENPKSCQVTSDMPCQEVVEDHPDLDQLPILQHCYGDGGPYISSGVVIARHPVYGLNADFHRCMQFSKTEMAVRVVQGRHFDRFLSEMGQVDVAVCIGCAPSVMVAAAISVELGVNELEIACALQPEGHPLQVGRALTVDVLVPAQAEFILEGTVYRDRRHAEGPFVDLTETQDVVRQEPVFEVKCITHRKDAIWQALLPGSLEHKLLMGMPREPTIFQKVNQVVKCLDVNISPGGCSWLHAIVQIEKQHEDDGIKAIQAAFAGHSSCKHVFVVDADVDIYNPLAVEWALATRFQGDQDLIMKARERGSSLDPSAEAGSHLTTKMGFDLTRPLFSQGKSFERVAYPNIDLKRFISG
jgi:2,5-furandicarboxylate decarboxylase 1